MALPPAPNRPPSRLGQFAIERELGRGAMGAVYLARDDRTGRQVAVKVMLVGHETDWERFLREIRVGATLDHPHIVSVLDSGLHKKRPYMVMEYVEGESLSDLIARDGLTPERAVEILLQVTRAIIHAHERGVLHRDIKPSNIMIDRGGQARLADFGLARVLEESSHLTRTGTMLGTPAFMPPEQAQGEKAKIGPASDIYSLGATLYMAVTGRVPFHGASDVWGAINFQKPDAPSKHNPDVPRGVDALVLRCMEKEPARRYPDAEALADALESALDGFLSGARPGYRSPARRVAAVLLVLVVLVGLGVGWTLTRETKPTEEATAPPPAKTEAPPPAKTAPPKKTEPPVKTTRPIPSKTGPPEPKSVEVSGLRFSILDEAGRQLGSNTLPLDGCPWRVDRRWKISAWAVGNVDDDPQLEVVLVAHHVKVFPAQIVVVEASGQVARRYWHPGWLSEFGKALILADLDGDGVQEILLGGTNNAAGRQIRKSVPVALALDGRTMSGEAPPRLGALRKGVERWYAVLDGKSGFVDAIRLEGDHLVANVRGQRGHRVRVRYSGQGVYGRRQVLRFPAGNRPLQVLCAELTGDARTDLVVVLQRTDGQGRVALIEQQAGGRFAAPRLNFLMPKKPLVRLALVDMDGNGLLDAAGIGPRWAEIWLQQKRGVFVGAPGPAPGRGRDVVALGTAQEKRRFGFLWDRAQGGSVMHFVQAVAGKLKAFPPAHFKKGGMRMVRLEMTDWNGDGRHDYAALTDTGQVLLFHQERDGSFVTKSPSKAPGPKRVSHGLSFAPGRSGFLAFTRGDAQGSATWVLRFNPFKGIFLGAPISLEASWEGDAGGVALYQVGKDARPAVATVKRAGVLQVYLGRRGGNFDHPLLLALESGIDDVVSEDLNGDGEQDLVVANPRAGTVTLLLSGPSR